MNKELGFMPSNILIPKNIDMQKWSVVACDQYTSEPKYWNEVENFVDGSPSTLHITFPEIYLEHGNPQDRINNINKNMQSYIDNDLFNIYENSYIYVERTVANGKTRKGLVGMVDLEEYNYAKGSKPLIRATEGTVIERIPPRVKIRKDAPLELPHIMLLIDDEENIVMNSVIKKEKIYDFDLMQNSGHITGYLVDDTQNITESLTKLYETIKQENPDNVLLYAVGDGNHSLATAKECWEQQKKILTDEQKHNHPARFALVELVNIHDDSLEFEPIHRVLFDCNPCDVIDSLKEYYNDTTINEGTGQKITYIYENNKADLYIKNPSHTLAVGTLQNFLDEYIIKKGGRVDYIHGDDVVENLASEQGNIGFLLPNMEKNELFKTVIIDGVLPRKTFSMGEAKEKRFYLECRKIK